MKEIKMDRKIAEVSLRITLVALALNAIFFAIPLILELMEKSAWKIIASYIIISYSFLVALFLIYFALKINIPKSD